MEGDLMKFVRTIAVILAVQLAQDAHGQVAVSGTVVSDETGDALPGTTVVIVSILYLPTT